MQSRHLAAWLALTILVGGGAAFLRAQPATDPPGRVSKEQAGRIRPRIIEPRTDVEMLRFDYELERDELLEDLKIARGLKLAGGLMAFGAAFQSAFNEEGGKTPGEPPPDPARARKEAVDKAKAVEEEKQAEANRAAFIEERKKKLRRRYALLAAKRLDLEDAERNYFYGTP